MSQEVHETGIFVGVANLKEDIEIIHEQIYLSKLRHMVVNVLQLHPFMKVMEKHIIEEMAHREDKSASRSVKGKKGNDEDQELISATNQAVI